MIIAIDPGPVTSAVVYWDGSRIFYHDNCIDNGELLLRLSVEQQRATLFIEKIASYGMAVGETVFETVFWSGRFAQAWLDNKGELPIRTPRREVKMHLCGSMRAKDGNIIQALKDRFGDKGTKKAPGITFGLAADGWQAFALAVTAFDTNCGGTGRIA